MPIAALDTFQFNLDVSTCLQMRLQFGVQVPGVGVRCTPSVDLLQLCVWDPVVLPPGCGGTVHRRTTPRFPGVIVVPPRLTSSSCPWSADPAVRVVVLPFSTEPLLRVACLLQSWSVKRSLCRTLYDASTSFGVKACRQWGVCGANALVVGAALGRINFVVRRMCAEQSTADDPAVVTDLLGGIDQTPATSSAPGSRLLLNASCRYRRWHRNHSPGCWGPMVLARWLI